MNIIRTLVGCLIGYCLGMAISLSANEGDFGVMFLSIAFLLFVTVFPYLVKWSIGKETH